MDSAINPRKCVRHLNVRIGEHIELSPLTKKKINPQGGAVSNHFLLCNLYPSYENLKC